MYATHSSQCRKSVKLFFSDDKVAGSGNVKIKEKLVCGVCVLYDIFNDYLEVRNITADKITKQEFQVPGWAEGMALGLLQSVLAHHLPKVLIQNGEDISFPNVTYAFDCASRNAFARSKCEGIVDHGLKF